MFNFPIRCNSGGINFSSWDLYSISIGLINLFELLTWLLNDNQ